MLLTQGLRQLARQTFAPRAPAGCQCAQRVEDHGDVDGLLRQCTRHRRQPAEGGKAHGEAGKAHAGDDALDGDAPRAPGDGDGLRHPIEPINDDYHVGRLRGGTGAAGAQSNADVRGCEGRGVVDAVAHHQGRMEATAP